MREEIKDVIRQLSGKMKMCVANEMMELGDMKATASEICNVMISAHITSLNFILKAIANETRDAGFSNAIDITIRNMIDSNPNAVEWEMESLQ